MVLFFLLNLNKGVMGLKVFLLVINILLVILVRMVGL